jgi:hypothetical protein
MTWGRINLGATADKLPAPGTYPGAVADLRLHEKPDALWCVVQFSLRARAEAPGQRLGFGDASCQPGQAAPHPGLGGI